VTLEQIEAMLPTGFRDARVRAVEADYVARVARIELVLDDGDPGGDDVGDQEAWRPARLLVGDLLFLVLEPPATRPEAFAGEARIGASAPATAAQRERLPAVPVGFFCHALFAANWNAHLFVAGRDARLEWTAPPRPPLPPPPRARRPRRVVVR
jgi:hypothetical protein